jgi:hypothetical protein
VVRAGVHHVGELAHHRGGEEDDELDEEGDAVVAWLATSD